MMRASSQAHSCLVTDTASKVADQPGEDQEVCRTPSLSLGSHDRLLKRNVIRGQCADKLGIFKNSEPTLRTLIYPSTACTDPCIGCDLFPFPKAESTIPITQIVTTGTQQG